MKNNTIIQYAESFKSGFIAIVGAPNVGKSTLLNHVLGQKISIISDKPQTTRNRILGVVHRPLSQMVFLDTPGIHSAKKVLNLRMVDEALSAIEDVDIILTIIDVSSPDPRSEELLIKKLEKLKKPVILALNKIDLIKKKQSLLHIINKWNKIDVFAEIIPISAINGTQVDVLQNVMENMLPKGPPFFPDESITDMPEKFIAAEMIREKVFRLTSEEIPYSTAVTVESFSEDTKKAIVNIHASIHVERDSQKGIIIGRKGSMLKKIGQQARREIEKMTGVRVFLKLFVRVQKNWTSNTRALRKLGY
ncbi:GTPase Era [Candidatus Magnetomoraceae bacterium gMMP-15]